jgi:hypothetical protein
MAQLNGEGVKIIKKKLSQGEEKYKYFHQDKNRVLWFESRIVVPKNHELRNKFLTRHIFPSSLFTRVEAKCIKILGKTFGGLE